MKSKIVFVVTILIFLIFVISAISNRENTAEIKPVDIEIGQEFLELKYEKTMYVLNYKIVDINHDQKDDMVITIGEKSKDTPNGISENIDVVVFDSNSSTFENCKIKKCSGKMPKLETVDMTCDGVDDIVLIVENEDKTKNVRIISKTENEYKEIFKSRDNRGIVFTGEFKEGFLLNLICAKLKLNKEIKMDERKENYISNKFYDQSGRVTEAENKITTSNFINIDFVLIDNQYALQTTQYIYGFNRLDIIDEITAIWKYENNRWSIKEARGTNIGSLLP